MQVFFGNAHNEGAGRRGWFIGAFLAPATDPRSTTDLEVKWAEHAAGEGRNGWSLNRQATTLSVLVSGRFRLWFPEQEIVLAQPGDYALWLPGVPHCWRAETACLVVSVRWPSLPDDSQTVPR